MEGRESAIFGLELITKKTLSPQEVDILKLFACENADEAAFQIDSFCPPLCGAKGSLQLSMDGMGGNG